MKKLFTIAIIAMAFIAAPTATAQFADLQKSPTDIAYAKVDRRAKPTIKVIYSRPQKKGRKVFGNLVPFDKVWRTGADEATEIKLFQDYKLGNQTIKAGTYSLFTIPGEKEWTIILNSDLDDWGHYSYKEGNDVARIKVPVASGEEVEAFSLGFKSVKAGYHLVMGWDTTRVEVPFYN